MYKTNYIIDVADKFLLNSAVSSLPIGIETLEGISHRNGWILETYATAQEFIENRHLKKLTEKCNAFVVNADDKHIILYNGDIEYNEKIFSICHEIGHIVLRHDLKRNIPIQEWEADVFAEEMISPTCSRAQTDLQESLCKQLGIRPHKVSLTALLILCIVILSLSLIGSIMIQFSQNSNSDYIRSAASHDISTDQTVYITVTGEKYHLAGCHYISNKGDLAEMTVAEAEQAGYDACKHCIY